jgi:translation initiation factor 2 subunit 2
VLINFAGVHKQTFKNAPSFPCFMDFDYEKLLDKAKEQLPEIQESGERFVIPKVVGHAEGSKIIISNFMQIAQALQRDPRHLLKYILKELASPGEVRKQYAVIGSKVPSVKINEKIEAYAQEYVFCKECGKPETALIKEGEYLFMRCNACGARNAVRSKI